MKNKFFFFTVVIAVYIIFRLLLVSSQRDQIFDYNEFFSGTIAMELIRGPSLPLKYCLPDDHSFGSMINGILIVPFYILFGPSTGAAKIVSIIFSAGVLFFWCLLLKRFFSRRAALIAGLLFIFSPTIYTKCSVLSMGAHPESNLFTAIIIFIFYLIFFGNKKGNIYFMVFGLVCGVALFYSYQCGVAILLIFMLWLLFDRKLILRPQFYLFLLFFLAGFSPRFYFVANTQNAMVLIQDFLLNAFDYPGLSFIIIKCLRVKIFLASELRQLFAFKSLPIWAGFIYFGVFITAFFSLSWPRRRLIYGSMPLSIKNKAMPTETPIFIFPLVFSAVYLLGNYIVWPGWQNSGYIVPLYPFIFVITGLFFDRIMRSGKKLLKIFAAALLSLIVLSGLYENLSLVWFSNIGLGFRHKGYSYRFFAERVACQHVSSAAVLDMIGKIDFPRKEYFLEGLGWGLVRRNFSPEERNRLEKLIQKKCFFDAKDSLFFYKGMGRGTAHIMDLYLYHKKGLLLAHEEGYDLAILSRIAQEKDAQKKIFFWEGFGQEVNPKSAAYQIVQDYIEDEFKPYLYRGIGKTKAWYSLNREYYADDLFAEFAPAYKKETFSSYKQACSGMLLKNKKAIDE